MDRLRALTVDQQVGLLFVTLLAVLVLMTLALLLRTLRDDTQTADATQALWYDLRALWLGSVVFWLAWASGAAGATVVFGVCSFLALREFITLVHTRRGDHRSLIVVFFLALPLQYLLVGLRVVDAFTVFVPVFVFLALPVVAALAGDPARFLERTAKIQWGIMVCVYGLSHAPALLLLDLPGYESRGAFLLFFLVMSTAAAQVTQELASRWMRRRPLVRQIDRNFSQRAWMAGVAAAAITGAALFWITPAGPVVAAGMAALAGGMGMLGDLVMRALKKDAGVRHWGNRSSLTGAVGLLDRVAPLCFAAPLFFHGVRWALG